MWREECMCWSVCCGMGVGNTTQYKYIWMLPGMFGKPEQTLMFHICTYGECICYVLCFHAWCLGFSWSYCSRETPGIQVGAGNISYHSQVTKQTSRHTCHTAILYEPRLHGHTLVVSLGACGLRSSTQVSLWESCYGELGQSRVTNKVWCGCDGDFKTCMVTAIFK